MSGWSSACSSSCSSPRSCSTEAHKAPDYHASSARGTVNTASIDTNDSRRDKHLRSPDFFDVDNYPTIDFTSTSIEHVNKGDDRVRGDLTMHGETHPIELEVTVHGVMHDPQGQDRVGVEVRGTLNRGEFGLRWQQAFETGGVMVGDEVRVGFGKRSKRPSSIIACAPAGAPPGRRASRLEVTGRSSTAPLRGESGWTARNEDEIRRGLIQP